MQRDPVGHAEGLNLYTYSLNNSINLTDPFGLRSKGRVTWGDIGQILWKNFDNLPRNVWQDTITAFRYPENHPVETILFLSLGQAAYGPKTFDTIPPGYRISPYRLTQPGEKYIRFESSRTPSKIFHGRVVPDTFAAKISQQPTQSELNQLYNLPLKDQPRNLQYIIQPRPGTWIEGPKPVGGGSGTEARFPFGSEGVSGPFPVPE